MTAISCPGSPVLGAIDAGDMMVMSQGPRHYYKVRGAASLRQASYISIIPGTFANF